MRLYLWTIETSAKRTAVAGCYQGENTKAKDPEHGQAVALLKKQNPKNIKIRVARQSLKMMVVRLSGGTPGED